MYGEIYYHTYKIKDTGQAARVSILKRDYTGTASFVQAGPVPFTKTLLNDEDNLIGGIFPTKAAVQLVGDSEFGMEDLYTANDTEYRVIHYVGGEIDWIGYILPETFGETDTEGVRYLDINAYDGLTKLKDLKFTKNDQNYGVSDGIFIRTLLFAIKECLLKTGLELDIFSLVDRVPVTLPATANTAEVIVPSPSSGDGNMYSYDLYPLPKPGLVVGNYMTWEYLDSAEKYTYTSKIISIFEGSDFVSIELDPAPLAREDGEWTRQISYRFFAPVGDTSQDVLAIATHDTRMWINTETKINRIKGQEDLPYWDWVDGTMTAWDVLDSIALTFDFRVMQSEGNWMLEAVDAYRISDQYFQYTFDGVYVARAARKEVETIPIRPTPERHRISGNTRYLDKTLKSTEVNYKYRFKVEGDPLVNLIVNGDFSDSTGLPADPNTYTPPGWFRKSSSALYLERTALPLTALLMRGGPGDDKFKWDNGISQVVQNTKDGDILYFGLSHSYTQHWGEQPYASAQQFVALCITIYDPDDPDEVYYLVNKSVGEDTVIQGGLIRMSTEQGGAWVKKKQDTDMVYFYKTNSFDVPPGTINQGDWTNWKNITIKADPAPISGLVNFTVAGSVTTALWQKFSGPGDDNTRPTTYRFYSHDVDAYNQTKEIVFIEEDPLNQSLFTSFENQFLDTILNPSSYFYPSIQVDDISITKTVEDPISEGRRSQYTQEGDYYENLSLEVPLGDEPNIDHLSGVMINGVVNDKWLTRDNSLWVGSLALQLTRSLMRRYYLPKLLLDGALSYGSLDLMVATIFAEKGTLWLPKNGDMTAQDHTFDGTMTQLPDTVLPEGGVDYGPNSMTSGSDSSSGGSSGGSSSGGSGSVLFADKARYADMAGFATKATSADSAATAVAAQTAVSADFADMAASAATAVNANAAVTAEKWGVAEFVDYINQALRTTDNVQFAQVSTGKFFLTLGTAPTSATDTGVVNEVRITATHIYVCVAANTWVRAELSTW